MSTENLKVVITGDVSDLDRAGKKAAEIIEKINRVYVQKPSESNVFTTITIGARKADSQLKQTGESINRIHVQMSSALPSAGNFFAPVIKSAERFQATLSKVENQFDTFPKAPFASIGGQAEEWDKLARRSRTLWQEEQKQIRALQQLKAARERLNTAGSPLISTATKASNAFRRVGTETNHANFAMISLAQGIGDIPYGFSAISNNMQQTVQALGYLRGSAKEGQSVLGLLGKSLTGPTGLFVGFSIVTAAITAAVNKYGSLGNALGQLTSGPMPAAIQSIIDFKDASAESTGATFGQVAQLKSLTTAYFENSKSLDKQKNIKAEISKLSKDYSDQLGKEIKNYKDANIWLGKYSELLITNAKIKAAQEVISKSYQEAFKKQSEIVKAGGNVFSTYFKNLAAHPITGLLSSLSPSNTTTLSVKSIGNAVDAASDAFKNADDTSKSLTQTLTTLNNKKADILKSLGIDNGNEDKINSTKNNVKTISDILNGLDSTFSEIGAKAEVFGLSLEQIATLKMAAINKAMIELAKINTPAAIEAAKKLDAQYSKIGKTSFLPTISGGRAQVNAPSGTGNINVPTHISEQVPEYAAGLNSAAEATDNWAKATTELSNAFESVFSAISEGGNPFKALIQAIEQVIIKLIAAAAAAAVLTVLTGGSFTAAAEVAGSFKSFFKGASGLSFANGGFIAGPQLAVVGDAPGGEWVLNQRQISAILNGGGSGRAVNVSGEFTIKGNDLVYVLDQSNRRNNRVN